ncbi:hypothetical protein COU16_00200 [Candidatus Kaiserbacteria bacterium CG10_big_fil_rev_8_21_14_0_10_47_16]|uniref:O-antigen ligase-related domain-containing protein n=1 Tax=Candidatus Kaiserbacteria bacterium CG10_big_fil_rev_8_21_14_0_10_47_16 TaxID=1974608 RepID=A0A2H0UEV9_9BACT|nr:MAG: hypothetical protein COU16_00200 [Candidatus Kaiserbacteria bacterium CG10_big_fil_rev_8_21_14_0_10_47_16]
MKDFLKWVVYVGIFALPFIVLIVSGSLFFPFITGKNFAFRIIVEIIFAAWVLLAVYEPQYRPKFSWIGAAFLGLIVVMFFANMFGQYAPKSFWSNFERMDGYVTLVHLFMYFVVIGSTLITKKLWDNLFNTTLFAATLVCIYAFAQLGGSLTINQGGLRLDATLGNAAYMAVYMLFHIFIAALMFTRTESRALKGLYAILAAVFVFILVQTATRGTILGLFGGALLTTLYIAIFGKAMPQVRKIAAGSLIAVVLAGALLVAFRDAPFIQNDPRLQRVANISLSEASTRFSIWSMAFEGVKEKPILGWGQENYNYVFNKYYKPSLYDQEPWFDRVHNIVLDWLIAGGIVGAFFYFSIIGSALYYIVIRPRRTPDESFTVVEQGLLLGLIAGYVFHNMFVFDNIISYLFFGTIIAFIHSRSAREMPKLMTFHADNHTVAHIGVPVVGVVLLAVVWSVNVPGIQAASDMLKGFQATTPEGQIAAFQRALDRGSFGSQEVREQMSLQTLKLLNAEGVSQETKQAIFSQTELVLLGGLEEKPDDARLEVFAAAFYRSTGNTEAALQHLAVAHALSPQKQTILFEEGIAYLQAKEYEQAREAFKAAYELAPDFMTARVSYAAAALYTGDDALFKELIATEDQVAAFAQSDLGVQAAYATGHYAMLLSIFETQLELDPSNPQARINLALTYYQLNETEKAVAVLQELAAQDPAYKDQVDAFIAALRAGAVPKQ